MSKSRERTPYPLMSVALLAPDLAFDSPLASGLQQRRAAGVLVPLGRLAQAGQGSQARRAGQAVK